MESTLAISVVLGGYVLTTFGYDDDGEPMQEHRVCVSVEECIDHVRRTLNEALQTDLTEEVESEMGAGL